MSKNCEHGAPQCDQCERERMALRILLLGIAIGIVIGLMVWRIATITGHA